LWKDGATVYTEKKDVSCWTLFRQPLHTIRVGYYKINFFGDL